ncbi:MAG: pyruvate kinase, partial [Burkholderiaceae bacterium]|nr:pyruvate kinase [Burkholderiaceae bacterium]
MQRARRARIVATLGPATAGEQIIRALVEAGADVFRLNFSHGSRDEHARRVAVIRALEAQCERPIGVLLDLQGPKLRLGTFEAGEVQLAAGSRFRLDLDPA